MSPEDHQTTGSLPQEVPIQLGAVASVMLFLQLWLSKEKMMIHACLRADDEQWSC